MKAIKQAQTRYILDSYNREDISYSRMNEMFNELADKHAINFAKWATDFYNIKDILYEQTWEQILNRFHKENDI